MKNPPAARGIIYDMDGLLFDTERMYTVNWHEVARRRGITLPADFTNRISGTGGEDLPRILAEIYGVPDGGVLIEECGELMRAQLAETVPVKPGALESICFFKENGYRLCVASGSPMPMIRGNLQKTGLLSYFDVLVTGQDFARGKPAPDIFIHAVKLLGCAPQDCTVLEDSLNGVKAGYAAGCQVIMVPDLTAPTDEVRPLCTAICKDLMEAARAVVRRA